MTGRPAARPTPLSSLAAGSVSCRSEIADVEIEPRLLSVLHLVHHLPPVRMPGDPDDEVFAVGILGRVDPLHRAARDRYDAEAHERVRIAGLGIVEGLEFLAVRQMVHQRELRHRPLVQLQKRDPRRVRAPPEGARGAATVDFLFVHPVQPAVEQLGRAVGGQHPLPLARNVDDAEIVVAREGDEASVRAEQRIAFLRRVARQPNEPPRRELVAEEIVGHRQDRGGPGPVEDKAAGTCESPDVALLETRKRAQRCFEGSHVVQRPGRPPLRIGLQPVHSLAAPLRPGVVRVVEPEHAGEGLARRVDLLSGSNRSSRVMRPGCAEAGPAASSTSSGSVASGPGARPGTEVRRSIP